MPRLDKERTITAILMKQSPFCNINEANLRKKAYQSGGVGLLKKVAKIARARLVYVN